MFFYSDDCILDMLLDEESRLQIASYDQAVRICYDYTWMPMELGL